MELQELAETHPGPEGAQEKCRVPRKQLIGFIDQPLSLLASQRLYLRGQHVIGSEVLPHSERRVRR